MTTSQAGGGIAPYHHRYLREKVLRVCRNQRQTGGLDAMRDGRPTPDQAGQKRRAAVPVFA